MAAMRLHRVEEMQKVPGPESVGSRPSILPSGGNAEQDVLYRGRTVAIRAGRSLLRLPRVREADALRPDLFSRLHLGDQALLLAMMESAATGTASSMVRGIVREVCGSDIPWGLVAQLQAKLDVELRWWTARSLQAHRYPFLLADAVSGSTRYRGRAGTTTCLIVTGVNDDGYREVIGLQAVEAETAETWRRLFGDLTLWGLRGIEMLVSDDRPGLLSGFRSLFPDASWQFSQRHLIERVLDRCDGPDNARLRSALRRLFSHSDPTTAPQVLADLQVQFPSATRGLEMLSERLDDSMTVLSLPESLRPHLRSDHVCERLTGEIARRARVIGSFPGTGAVWRTAAALCLEHEEAWIAERRYVHVEARTPAD